MGVRRACAKGHSGRRAIGQIVLIGNFRRRITGELLVGSVGYGI